MYPLALQRNLYPCFWASQLDYSVSTILHYFGLWGLGRGTEFSGAGRYFLIQGLGVIILEHLWKYITGRWVGGVIGRFWTFAWAVGMSKVVSISWPNIVGGRKAHPFAQIVMVSLSQVVIPHSVFIELFSQRTWLLPFP